MFVNSGAVAPNGLRVRRSGPGSMAAYRTSGGPCAHGRTSAGLVQASATCHGSGPMRPLVVPDDLHRNAAEVHAHGPENTGSVLIELACQRLGLESLAATDVLDVGCGVRF